MRVFLARVGRLMDATGPGHATALLGALGLLVMASVWIATGGAS